jgi:hypothetical protein
MRGIPAILLMDPEGRIIAKHFGADTLTTDLRRWLK